MAWEQASQTAGMGMGSQESNSWSTEEECEHADNSALEVEEAHQTDRTGGTVRYQWKNASNLRASSTALRRT